MTDGIRQARTGLLVLALLSGLAGRVVAQGVTGAAVQGTVAQIDSSRVEGARVELKSTQGGQTYTATTGANGRYFIDNVQPGPGLHADRDRDRLQADYPPRHRARAGPAPEPGCRPRRRGGAARGAAGHRRDGSPDQCRPHRSLATDLGQRDRPASAAGTEFHRSDSDQSPSRRDIGGRTEQPLQQSSDRRRRQQRRLRTRRDRFTGRPGAGAAHFGRGDQGVPGTRGSVRRPPGKLYRRPGQHHHEVGDQRLVRVHLRLLPGQGHRGLP